MARCIAPTSLRLPSASATYHPRWVDTFNRKSSKGPVMGLQRRVRNAPLYTAPAYR
jgi:hypothetical protein